MTIIRPTVQPAYWIIAAHNLDGITRLGEMTAVSAALTPIFGEGEMAFLSAARNSVGTFKPLPTTGWLEAGAIFGHSGSAVIVRQAHSRTTHNPADVPALFSVWRDGIGVLDWIANEPVTVGTRRTFGGKTWECIQAHTTQTDWTPDKTPTLWREVTTATTPQPWKQPTGAHDAYKIGDRVTFNGRLWESTIDANVWSPAVHPAGWKDLGIHP